MIDRAGTANNRIFVARPFDASGQRIYENLIVPTLDALSLAPIHGPFCDNELIVAGVLSAIERSVAVLAVLVGQNRNVFVEVGMAIGLRKPLVLLAGAEEDAGMLRAKFPVVLLREPEKLQQELAAFVDHRSPRLTDRADRAY